MNTEALIAEFRRVRDDSDGPPFLWSDDEIVTYINDAIDQACERARLIEDRTTPEVCTIGVAIGVSTYELHQSVMKVKRVTLDGSPLEEVSVEQLDAARDEWETDTGTPRFYVLENETGLRLYPSPIAAGTLNLTVYRGQLTPLSADRPSESPEIHERHHLRIMPWVYRCAMLKNDSQTFDAKEADKYEVMFARFFGQLPDANVIRKQRDRRPHRVRSSWP